ncbi:MAG: Ig-like domain-containing protein, partial [Allobaculum sp.]|nr:Ig-like domain-containing protein [Allobaculum sp.]
LYLPDGFSDLGAGAFSKANFESVSLPISLLTISEYAFQDAGRFNLEWRIPEDYKYDGNPYNVIYNAAFRSALTNTEVIVPEGVNEIRYLAFNNNNIKSISLPSTLQILCANALQKGEGGTVETIYCLAKTPPSVDTSYLLDKWVDNIFKGVIYVPAESLTRYRQNGFWGKYNIQPIPVDVSGVSLSAVTVALKEGETYQLTATVDPSDATDKSLEWTSSDERVALVSATGMVTAINEGTAVITVSASNGIAATCVVTVEARILEMEAVILNAEALALEVGDTYQLTATVVPADTTYPELEWSTDDERVAVVDQNGLVTIIGEGETLICVRSAVWRHVEAVCRINAVADVRGIICNDQPCDIYSFSGELLRKDAPVSEMEQLRNGVYIICQGTTRIKLIK